MQIKIIKTGVSALVGLAATAFATGALAGPTPQQLYIDNCAACHQKTGLGIPGAFPTLKGSKFVQGDPKAFAHTLLFGRGGMPAFKDSLSDQQLAQISTYVRTGWGNKGAVIPPAVFTAGRKGAAAPSKRLQAH